MPKVRAKCDLYSDGAYREKGAVFEHNDDRPDPNLEVVHNETPAGPPPPEPRRPGAPPKAVINRSESTA